ncbi:uncharacterized protein LOC108917897 [Anoplophora glabripennis]|uniref:uncharacterized protein LOC108917897 n=1 Tax=Anoplophora glabripennis TaxID=217634 RepID=UPI0008736C57|nr:uncharacterized protein LOC108917897 [Anoplophora glabripennis]
MEKVFGLSKCCKNIKVLLDIKQLLRSSHNIPRIGMIRFYRQPILKRQTLCDNLKIKKLLMVSNVAVQPSSNFSNKSKKIFGFIFTRKGAVLIGVLLSIVIGYHVILVGICAVLDEVIKKTIK